LEESKFWFKSGNLVRSPWQVSSESAGHSKYSRNTKNCFSQSLIRLKILSRTDL